MIRSGFGSSVVWKEYIGYFVLFLYRSLVFGSLVASKKVSGGFSVRFDASVATHVCLW